MAQATATNSFPSMPKEAQKTIKEVLEKGGKYALCLSQTMLSLNLLPESCGKVISIIDALNKLCEKLQQIQ